MQRWNFLNRIEAVEGTYILDRTTGTDSMILLGMIGPEYQYVFADVRMNGKNSDGINWSPSPFKISLENNSLNLPELHALSDQKMRFRNKK